MAFNFDVIIIGSGFGATVLALDQAAKGKTVMIVERGVWWLTPELSVENPMAPYLKARPDSQPVQYWPRPDHRRGLTDFLATVKATGVLGDLQDFANGFVDFFTDRKRPQPLYRYSSFPDADIITASGVGGGSRSTPTSRWSRTSTRPQALTRPWTDGRLPPSWLMRTTSAGSTG